MCNPLGSDYKPGIVCPSSLTLVELLMPNSIPFWVERVNQLSLSKGNDSYISSHMLTIGSLFLAIHRYLVYLLFTLSCQLHTQKLPFTHVTVGILQTEGVVFADNS